MPTITPSKESQQYLEHPINVVNRAIDRNSVVQKHKHTWGQFIYANKGVLSVVTDTERYIVPPEQGVWILPYVNHEVTALTHVELTSFYLNHTTLNTLPEVCCVLSINSFLKSLIIESKKITLDNLYQEPNELLLQLILLKLSCSPKVTLQLPYPKDKRLLTMLSMIKTDPANKYDLAQWGKVVGASSRTLSRLFKTETGITYNQWRKRLTLQIAISKLGSGEAIGKIAADLGYESPSAFSYMFRESTGVTPSYYRDKS